MSINMLTSSRLFEFGSKIVEWDMRRAGLNLIREYKLLPQEKIDFFSSMEKKESDIAIGKLQIKDREFSRKLEQAFTDMMNTFIKANNVNIDYDVISIKKDACFLINKAVKQSKFGEYVEFVPKNTYHAFIGLRPLEFYFSRDNGVDVKNLIGDKRRRAEILELHKNGILQMLEKLLEICEQNGRDAKRINEYLHTVAESYKRRMWTSYDWYREFNADSTYRLDMNGLTIMANNIDESLLPYVDIRYNYINIIMPLIDLVVY